MAERYNFKYLPLVGKLPGKSMVEQTETAINELASVVYDNVGHVGNLAEEVQTANTNASNALDKATEALETSSRVYIKQIAAVDVNDYYDSELYYIDNDGSTNIPVRDRGFLEVKTNDDKTACEQVFISDSTGTPYYRHGVITEQTLGEESTYVVTWSSWYREQQADWDVTDTSSKAYVKNKPNIKLSGLQNVSASLVINPTVTTYNEDLRLNQSAAGWASIYLGGSLNSMSGPEEHAWGIFRDPSYALGIWPNDSSNKGKKGLYLPLNGRATLDGKTVILDGDTVDRATADAAGNNIQTTYAKKQEIASTYLPLSGGTLTGAVNGVTPTAGDNSTKIATTEFVNATTKAAIGYYNSVDEMRKSETAIVGRPCMTLGYYAPNDGGGAVYIIRSKKESDVDDGGSILVLDNRNVAEMLIEDAVNVKQFGAKGDGVTDDTAAIQNAINYSISHGKGGVEGSNCIPVVIPNGKYRTTATINITKNLSNWELHAESSIINYEGGDYAFYINRLRYSSLHFGIIDATKAGGCIHFKSIYDGTNDVDWFQYVNIYFDILQAKTDCILSETENKGWGNEVRLFGGRFRAGQYGLRIENNGQTIITKWGCYNIGIEGVSCGVGLHNNGTGQIWEMLFVNCRTEEAKNVLETVGECKWCMWIDPYPVDYSKFKLSINTRTFKFITGTDYIDIPRNYSIDANSLLNVGSYRIDDWDTARKSTNFPEKSPGILTVLFPDRSNIYYVTQKYAINNATGNNSTYVYQRTWRQESQTWSEWQRVDGWSMRFGYKVVEVDSNALINSDNPQRMSFIAMDNGVVQVRCNGKIVALSDNTIGIGRMNNPNESHFKQYVDSIPVRKGHQVYIETIGVTEANIKFAFNG